MAHSNLYHHTHNCYPHNLQHTLRTNPIIPPPPLCIMSQHFVSSHGTSPTCAFFRKAWALLPPIDEEEQEAMACGTIAPAQNARSTSSPLATTGDTPSALTPLQAMSDMSQRITMDGHERGGQDVESMLMRQQSGTSSVMRQDSDGTISWLRQENGSLYGTEMCGTLLPSPMLHLGMRTISASSSIRGSGLNHFHHHHHATHQATHSGKSVVSLRQLISRSLSSSFDLPVDWPMVRAMSSQSMQPVPQQTARYITRPHQHTLST